MHASAHMKAGGRLCARYNRPLTEQCNRLCVQPLPHRDHGRPDPDETPPSLHSFSVLKYHALASSSCEYELRALKPTFRAVKISNMRTLSAIADVAMRVSMISFCVPRSCDKTVSFTKVPGTSFPNNLSCTSCRPT